MSVDDHDVREDLDLMDRVRREASPVTAGAVLAWARALRRIGSPAVVDIADAMDREAEAAADSAQAVAEGIPLPLASIRQAARSVAQGHDRETEAQWLVTEALDGERVPPDLLAALERRARAALRKAVEAVMAGAGDGEDAGFVAVGPRAGTH